ncbi:MAG TPA: anthranilate synthase component I family protein [Candidatus Saccharimonadaceae bacterium]|jgi:para-aminobenzoate synthetase component 1|nr:anthranilate synthase component I family protein [Candidatus Saccharimonadaceae bacterium]
MPSGLPLPLVRGVDVADPLIALHALRALPHRFLLHSSLEDARARWSFFGAEPFSLYKGGDYRGGTAAFRRVTRRVADDENASSLVPFTGGAVGYWAYDFGRRLENLRSSARPLDDLELPDFVLGFYDVIGAFDHRTRETWLFSSGLPLEGERRVRHAERRLERFAWLLERAATQPPARAFAASTGLVSTFEPDAYRAAVERVREHIRAGDLFQANLSQRWTLGLEECEPALAAEHLMRELAAASPAPYAAYLDAGDHAIASASPECFLNVRGRRVETRPIKGTRPRDTDPARDHAEREALLASAKDRAENVMIVDVMRNDLGRVCVPGSVETPALCAPESFPQVHHLVSTVTGVLEEGRDALDLLHACFPGGSITGAPKIRAMEILDTLEPVRRHVYTGSVGYLDWHGAAEWNIAIRTALVTARAAHFAAGGGITADSDPDAEYVETLHKAAGLRRALGALTGQSLEIGVEVG